PAMWIHTDMMQGCHLREPVHSGDTLSPSRINQDDITDVRLQKSLVIILVPETFTQRERHLRYGLTQAAIRLKVVRVEHILQPGEVVGQKCLCHAYCIG